MPDDANAEEEVKIKDIIFASFRGLFLWLLFYVVVLHCFAYWKWDTPEVEEDLPELPPPKMITNRSDMPQLQDIVNLQKDLREAQERTISLTQVRETLKEYSRKLEEYHAPKLYDPDSIVAEDIEQMLFTTLLEKSSLIQLNDDALDEMFQNAMNELDTFANQNRTIRWEQVNDLLFETTIPDKVTVSQDHLQEMLCPPPPKPKESWLRESERAIKIADMRRLLEGRLESRLSGVFQNEAYRDLLQKRAQKVDDEVRSMQENTAVEEVVVTESFPMTECKIVTISNIHELLNAGLAALESGTDLRKALERKAKELNPEIGDLMLDAILPTEPPIPEILPVKEINLGRTIDTPILKQSTKWIDLFVEVISGHNDQFDQLVDDLSEKYKLSMGDLAISMLLEKAHSVNIPVPNEVHDFIQKVKTGNLP